MKKLISTICFLVLASLPFNALAWGSATHTYLAYELGRPSGYNNLQEIYGAVAPDMFNLLYGNPHQEFLYTLTHHQFRDVVNLAKFGSKKAFAYGFASHNELWGADYTAHIDGLICPVPDKGYVVLKTELLTSSLIPIIDAFLTANGIPHTPQLVAELSYDLADSCVEGAIDLLVSQNQDPQVGLRMLLAAGLRDPFTPILLATAYADDITKETGMSLWQAGSMIIQTEKQFQDYMKLYGKILTQPNRLDLMTEQGAQMAEQRLAQEYGINVEVPADLMKTCLTAAMSLIQSDYSTELSATLSYVDEQLEVHDIETTSW